MAEFVLKVKDVPDEGRTWTFPIRAAWLGEVLEGSDLRAGPRDGHLEVRAQRSGADVIVTGRARAPLLTDCSRCLEDATVEADAEIGVLLTARGDRLRPPPDEVELTPEDLQREFFTGEEIVLDDLVREHLILEVPMQPLCAETCAGIAHAAGPPAEDPGAEVDPRLAPLRRFRPE